MSTKCADEPKPVVCTRTFKQMNRSYCPNYQNARAEKLVTIIDANVKETITSIDNLKVETDREIIALLTETNSFANDLETLVYSLLRLVIKSYKNGQAAADLAKSAKLFSDYVYTIQKSFHHDVTVLKQLLKLSVASTTPEAKNLLKLVNSETDNAMRQSIVGIMDDILFVVRKALHRNQIEQNNVKELKLMAHHKMKHEIISAVDSVKKTDDTTMDEFNSCTEHYIRHIQLAVRTIDEESDGYEGHTKTTLSKIAYNMSEDLATLDKAIRKKSDVDAIKEHVKVCVRSLSNETGELATLGDKNSHDKKVSVNLNNLVLLIFAHNMAAANQYKDNIGEFLSKA